MKHVAVVIVAIFLLSGAATALSQQEMRANGGVPTRSDSAVQYGDGYRYNVQGLIYVHVEGDALERGRQHGHLLYPEIMDMLYRWANTIHNAPVISALHINQSSERYQSMSERWWSFCRSRAMNIFWDNYPAEYQQEVKGIAQGVANRGGQLFGEPVAYEDILTLNEMYEFMSMLVNPAKSIHPLRSLYYDLLGVAPELEEKQNEFITALVNQPPAHHCNGFIATGDATTNGQMVASDSVWFGSWWYSYYIAQRWNVILDIVPSRGNRIVMGTSPGLIWSDEDYYQNDQGLVLIETTCPQGLWKKNGLPLAVRARTAMQYGSTVDDAIDSLRSNSNGIMNAVWLIGDATTGEIARFELGLYESAVWRTTNGFYWSANNPMDASVRREQLRLESAKGVLFRAFNILFNTSGYEYYTLQYHPSARDLKFEEMGNEYYGSIDAEVVKKIMSTPPMTDFTSDCKLTDSYLLEDNGLWAFWGNTGGKIWNTSQLQPNLRGIVDVPPAGWVRMYGMTDGASFSYQPGNATGGGRLKWVVNTTTPRYGSPAITVDSGTIYVASDSMIEALDGSNGNQQWSHRVGEQPVRPLAHDGMVYAGSASGLYALNDGTVVWSHDGTVCSQPVYHNGKIIAGGNDSVSCHAAADGTLQWTTSVNGSAYVSAVLDDHVYAAAGHHCYAIDVTDGSISWTFAAGAPMTSSPAVHDTMVYVGSWDNHIYALDADSGEMQWKYATGWGVDTTPAVDDDHVYLGSMDNSLYCLDATDGELQWMQSFASAVHSSPVLYGDYVFFGCDDGHVYACNRSTGATAWSYAPAYTMQRDVYNFVTTAIRSTPALAEQTCYVGAAGHVYALDAQTEPWPMKSETGEDDGTAGAWWLVAVVLGAIAGAGAYLWYSGRLPFIPRP
ncbi:MAG: PQQ-binding-like beta-propeller repeat protein [Thermoplasmatota archaeon]